MQGNFKDIISRLEQQKTSIDRALAALREFDEGGSTGVAAEPTTPRKTTAKKTGKKRVLSAEGRERIAAAARKRWAAKKKASKKLASVA